MDNLGFDNDLNTSRVITINNSGGQPYSTRISDSLGAGDPQDTVRIQLNQRSSLILATSSDSGDVNLSLLDYAGGTLIQSANSGSMSEAIVTEALAPGTYYVQASLVSGNPNYSLDIRTSGSGRNDLLWRNYSPGNGAIISWQLSGTTYTGEQSLGALNDPTWKIQATGDFDGDGNPDLFWRNQTYGENTIWLLDANSNYRGSFPFGRVADTEWSVSGTGDLNGDGSLDLVWHRSSGENIVWYLNGTNYIGDAPLPTNGDPAWKLVGIADFSGDRRPDLLWRNSISGSNIVWQLDNNNYVRDINIPTIQDTNWKVNGTGDFNGDGKTDIIWRNYGSGSNVVWFFDGVTYLGEAALGPIADPNWVISGVLSSPATPVDLAGNTSTTAFDVGTLNSSGGYNNERVGGTADANDYYKFSLSGTGTVNLSLQGLQVDTDLVLYRETNGALTEIAASRTAGTASEAISNLSLTQGVYYALVTTAASVSTPYSLSLGWTPPPQADLASSLTSPFRVTSTSGVAYSSANPISLNTPTNTVRVNYNISNRSLANASAFKVAFYLSTDSTIDTTDKLFTGVESGKNFVTIAGLGAGLSTGARTIDLTLPGQSDTFWKNDQTYYIGMIIDSGNEVSEVREDNNKVSYGISIKDTSKPDLVGGGLTVGAASGLKPGDLINLSGSIRNSGSGASNKGLPTGQSVVVRFYLSDDDIQDSSDVRLSDLVLGTIGAGGTINFNSTTPNASGATFTSEVRLPGQSDSIWGRGTGTYYIVMQIDANGVLPEVSKTNNRNYGRTLTPTQFLDYDPINVVVT